MQHTTPISVSVLGGSGLIGRRHVTHILAEPTTTLHSIVDPTPSGLALAKELSVPYHSDLPSLLSSNPRPTAAILATPSSLHVSQALELVKRGIHVLIEKPLCSTSAEALPLLQASQQNGAGSILIGFHRRFNPYILRLKSILEGQSSLGKSPVGKLLAVSGLWCARKPASYFQETPWRQSMEMGGGVIMINLSHELDLMRFLIGPVRSVCATFGEKTRGFDVEETVAITLTFRRTINPSTPFLGTQGTLSFPNMEHWGGNDGDWTQSLIKTNVEALPFDKAYATDLGEHAPFTVRLQHWVKALRGEEPINCSLDEGIANVQLLEAIVKSAREGVPVAIV